jgi:hypothetical protein
LASNNEPLKIFWSATTLFFSTGTEKVNETEYEKEKSQLEIQKTNYR